MNDTPAILMNTVQFDLFEEGRIFYDKLEWSKIENYLDIMSTRIFNAYQLLRSQNIYRLIIPSIGMSHHFKQLPSDYGGDLYMPLEDIGELITPGDRYYLIGSSLDNYYVNQVLKGRGANVVPLPDNKEAEMFSVLRKLVFCQQEDDEECKQFAEWCVEISNAEDNLWPVFTSIEFQILFNRWTPGLDLSSSFIHGSVNAIRNNILLRKDGINPEHYPHSVW